MPMTPEENQSHLVLFFERLIDELAKKGKKLHKKSSDKGRATALRRGLVSLMENPYSQNRKEIRRRVTFFIKQVLKRQVNPKERTTLNKLLDDPAWTARRRKYIESENIAQVREAQEAARSDTTREILEDTKLDQYL